MAFPSSGRAAVTAPDRVMPLRSGGSGTLFSLALPSGSRCAGDSAHGGYRIYSFLLPRKIDPVTDTFPQTVPGRYYGMYTETRYYGADAVATDTGQVVNIPADLTWQRLSAPMLLSGSRIAEWTAGLACVNSSGVVENHWDAYFLFAASSADPGGFTFVVQDQAAPSQSGSRWVVVVLVVAVALIIGAVAVWRRLSPRPAPASGH